MSRSSNRPPFTVIVLSGQPDAFAVDREVTAAGPGRFTVRLDVTCGATTQILAV